MKTRLYQEDAIRKKTWKMAVYTDIQVLEEQTVFAIWTNATEQLKNGFQQL